MENLVTSTSIKFSAERNKNAKWYVIHVFSGQEKKASITLAERIRTLNLQDQINEVVIPTQKKITMNKGQKKEVSERMFPGYMLVLAEVDDYVWQTITSTPGVTGFVGIDNKPTPISEKEVRRIKDIMVADTPEFEIKHTIGDAVKIVSGPFKDVLGKINEINTEQGKIEVLITVFDREVPVEVDATEIENV